LALNEIYIILAGYLAVPRMIPPTLEIWHHDESHDAMTRHVTKHTKNTPYDLDLWRIIYNEITLFGDMTPWCVTWHNDSSWHRNTPNVYLDI